MYYTSYIQRTIFESHITKPIVYKKHSWFAGNANSHIGWALKTDHEMAGVITDLIANKTEARMAAPLKEIGGFSSALTSPAINEQFV